MKKLVCLSLAMTSIALVGCGGGDSAPSLPAPPVGQKVDFAVTGIDNSNNTMSWMLEYTVLSSSPDGSYTQSAVGNGSDVAVNGTVYGRANQVDDYDAQHHMVSYTNEGPPPDTCTFAQPRVIQPPGATVGSPWPPFSDSVTCSNGYQYAMSVQNGSIVDIENVTVPAGTFSTKKLVYDITQVNTATGATTTRHVTGWYDVVSGREVQLSVSYTYTGQTFTTGYLVHEVQMLLTAP